MPDLVEIKKESRDSPMCDGEPMYPYGTRLSFDSDMLEKLGMSALAPGDKVMVHAEGMVTDKSEHSTEDESDMNMGVQLTAIVVRRQADKDLAETLYGGD